MHFDQWNLLDRFRQLAPVAQLHQSTLASPVGQQAPLDPWHRLRPPAQFRPATLADQPVRSRQSNQFGQSIPVGQPVRSILAAQQAPQGQQAPLDLW